MSKLTHAVALDCEMVGVGYFGEQDMAARVSLVNEYGECLIDTFVKPTRKVVDYRTHVSGVRKSDLENGDDFDEVQNKVKNILRGRILVGHGLMEHDLKVLKLSHPACDIRDTAEYAPFRRMNRNRSPALRWLARHYLGVNIQVGEHSSVEDARAVMKIYKMFSTAWEDSLGN